MNNLIVNWIAPTRRQGGEVTRTIVDQEKLAAVAFIPDSLDPEHEINNSELVNAFTLVIDDSIKNEDKATPALIAQRTVLAATLLKNDNLK